MDASAKETQANLLAKKLSAALFSFPNYETETGKLIKRLLISGPGSISMEEPKQDGTNGPVGGKAKAYTLQALMTVNRLEQLGNIMHYLNNGKNVVLDRWCDSGRVYGSIDGLPAYWLDDIHQSLPEPDITIFVDIPVEESFRRRPDRLDDYEKNVETMQKARDNYYTLYMERPNHYIINGVGDISEIHKRIMEVVNKNVEGT